MSNQTGCCCRTCTDGDHSGSTWPFECEESTSLSAFPVQRTAACSRKLDHNVATLQRPTRISQRLPLRSRYTSRQSTADGKAPGQLHQPGVVDDARCATDLVAAAAVALLREGVHERAEDRNSRASDALVGHLVACTHGQDQDSRKRAHAIESRRLGIAEASNHITEGGAPKTMVDTTMITMRLSVLATEWVTGDTLESAMKETSL